MRKTQDSDFAGFVPEDIGEFDGSIGHFLLGGVVQNGSKLLNHSQAIVERQGLSLDPGQEILPVNGFGDDEGLPVMHIHVENLSQCWV